MEICPQCGNHMALEWDVTEGVFRQCIRCGKRTYPDEGVKPKPID